MIISKSQGEKLTYKDMESISGGACGGNCGNCDCTKTNGGAFFGLFNSQMTAWEGIYLT